MRSAPAYTVETSGYAAVQRRHWGVVAGVGLSLALHAVLIFGYRVGLPPPATAPIKKNEALTVWIRPAPMPMPMPPAPVVAAHEPVAKPTTAPPRVKRETARKPLDTDIAASHPAPAQAPSPSLSPSQAITLPPRDKPAEQAAQPSAPKFDMEAARRTARAVADEPDPKRAPGTLAAQLDQHPLYEKSEETQLARDIGSAKRRDCKDGVPGGLLAPLFLLMDKKDSGCKW